MKFIHNEKADLLNQFALFPSPRQRIDLENGKNQIRNKNRFGEFQHVYKELNEMAHNEAIEIEGKLVIVETDERGSLPDEVISLY